MSGVLCVLAGKQTASGGSVSVTDQTISSLGSINQTATYRLNTSGIVQEITTSSGTNTLETWLSSGTASDFEARATLLTGTFSGGTAGSWLGLSSSQEWFVSANAPGVSKTASFTIEIRLAAPPNTVLDSATIEVSAERF